MEQAGKKRGGVTGVESNGISGKNQGGESRNKENSLETSGQFAFGESKAD